uniref:Transposase (Putative), gypsy type n=1 Tax=Tanacetum cinerariifolium TaxID=118510 RepID=A0A6L2LV58_TANCI|nr:transposase (putative), gypsy type [Tanacetum cinerariifolium]
MSTIKDIKCVLSQKAFSAFCEKFHIPEEVHLVLPNRDNTIHERPVGKIRLYTSRHYTLDEDTHPSFVDKDKEDMDIFAFIHTLDPTKVKVVEHERQEDNPRLLETIVGRTIHLLLVAPDRGESELESSVDKLFDEGGSGTQVEQRDSTGGGGVQGDPISILPFMTSSVSAIPEREGEGHNDSVTELNLRTISAPQRFGISSDSSHHSGANMAETEVDFFTMPSVSVITAATTVTSTDDPAIVIKEKIVKPSLISADSALAGGTDHVMGSFMDLSGSDFLVGGIRTVISLDTDLQKLRMRAEYNIKENRRLASVVEEKNQLLKSRDKEIKNLKAQLLLREAKVAKAIHLRAEASHFEVTKKSLRDEVNALNGRNTILEKEHNALDVKVTDLEATVVSKERELTDSNAQLTGVTLHLEEKFYPYLFTTIVGRRWLLTHGMELAIAKCQNLPEYLSALGPAVSKAIEKGMQDGLAAGITHGREGRALTDVAAHNPSAEADYVSALQQLLNVNFPLLAELKMNKDASIEALMNILRLEEHLVERLGLNESQPHADQLMVPIHHSSDKTVVGACALSLALDVSDVRVRRIKENIMSHRSLFQDVSIPLAEPLSAAALTGMEGTSDVMPATADITTSMSVTLTSAGTVVDEDTNPFPNVDDAELNIPQ